MLSRDASKTFVNGLREWKYRLRSPLSPFVRQPLWAQVPHLLVYSALVIQQNRTDMPPPKTMSAARGTVRGSSFPDIVRFTIRANPLPKAFSTFVLDNLQSLKKLQRESEAGLGSSELGEDIGAVPDPEEFDLHGDIIRKPAVAPNQFWTALQNVCTEIGGEWSGVTDNIMSFGPYKAGGCVLIDARKTTCSHSYVLPCLILSYIRCHLTFCRVYSLRDRLERCQIDQVHRLATETFTVDFDSHLETAFQLAVSHGPLCAEPIEGMAYFVESVETEVEALQKEIGWYQQSCHLLRS
jgi:ribosome assembly protein 1